MSEPRRGQVFAFVMDTRLCDGVDTLLAGADLAVVEATYADEHEHLAREHGHLTARQAAAAAARAGTRRLVLTHVSQRYPDLAAHEAQARAAYDGDLVVARDLDRVAVPPRA